MSVLRIGFSGALLCALLTTQISNLSAATFYWDSTAGSGNGVGGSATWGTTFSAAATGSTTLSTAATTDSLIFQGTAGAITLGANQTAASLTLNTTDYKITGNSSTTRTITGPITLAASTNLIIGNGETTDIAIGLSSISGTTGSTLTINGAATGSALTRLNLSTGTTPTISVPITITGTGFAGIAGGASGSQVTSTVNGNGARLNLGATSGNSITFTQTINNSTGTVRIAAGSSGGAGVVTLSGTGNTWGATELNNAASGILRMGVVDALPTSTTLTFGTTTANGDSIVELSGKNTTIGQLTNGAQSGGTLRNTSATGAQLTISGSDASASAFSGSIQDGTGAGLLSLVRSGTGTTILSGTSTYTGGTTVSGGTLTLGNATDTLANAGSILVSGGTLALGTNTDTVGAVTISSGSITGSGTSAQGVLTGTSYALTGTGTISAKLAGASVALTKSNAGTATLSSANTYTGATNVNGGKLSIASTGSINSSSGVTIAGGEFNYNSSTALTPAITFSGTGGKLTGSGTVNSAVTISSGNTLAPGNSIGTQTFGAGLSIAGTYSAELGTAGATPAAGVSDRAAVTGNLVLTGGTLALVDNAGANSQGSAGAGAYRLATFTGTRTGTFSTVTNPLSATLHEVVNYNGTTNGSVDLSLFRLATATAPASTAALGNVRVGSALTGTASISNSASNDGFSEQLKATVASNGTGFTGIAGGSSGTVNYSLATTAAGAQSGSASVVLKSTGVGSYSDTTLSTTSVSLSGNAYDLANPQVTSSNTIAFGNVHVGASNPTSTVSVANTTITNASFQDSLNASASTDNAKVTGNSFTAQAAGTTGSLTLTANAATVGSLASSVTLGYTSNANSVVGLSNQALTSGSVTTTGQVYSGQSTWTGGSGSWGTQASGFGANWGANQGSPGLDAGFKGVDTATFSAAGTNTVQLNGANPNVNQLSLSTGSYTIAPGSGGGITLSGSGSTIVSSGTQSISAPIVLGANASINNGGTLNLSGGVVKDGRTLTFTGGGQVNITGTGISGSSANSDLIVDNATLVVGASSTYNGPTTVQNSSTLVANAPISTNSVTVSGNSKLSGTSSVSATAGSVFINGTLQIGDPTVVTPTASTFSVSSASGGSTVLGSSSIMKIDLFLGAGSGNNSGLVGASDLLSISGDWTINTGAKLNIASTMTGFAANDEWRIFDLSALGVRTGAFDLSDISAPGLNPGLVWDYSRLYTDGDIFVVSVPEPGRALLLFAGLASIIGRRQRK
jgi:fibronectin-binding autotransporter adhesin